MGRRKLLSPLGDYFIWYVTLDETWIQNYTTTSHLWSTQGFEASSPKQLKTSAGKVIASVFWGCIVYNINLLP